jgi:hypothetical protein
VPAREVMLVQHNRDSANASGWLDAAMEPSIPSRLTQIKPYLQLTQLSCQASGCLWSWVLMHRRYSPPTGT